MLGSYHVLILLLLVHSCHAETTTTAKTTQTPLPESTVGSYCEGSVQIFNSAYITGGCAAAPPPPGGLQAFGFDLNAPSCGQKDLMINATISSKFAPVGVMESIPTTKYLLTVIPGNFPSLSDFRIDFPKFTKVWDLQLELKVVAETDAQSFTTPQTFFACTYFEYLFIYLPLEPESTISNLGGNLELPAVFSNVDSSSSQFYGAGPFSESKSLLTNSATLDLSFEEAPVGQLSVGMWIKTNSSSGTLFHGALHITLHDSRISAMGMVAQHVPVDDNQWHHVLVTCCRGDSSSLSIDGKLQRVGQSYHIDPEANTWSIAPNFNGEIDDVRLFGRNVPLSAMYYNYGSVLCVCAAAEQICDYDDTCQLENLNTTADFDIDTVWYPISPSFFLANINYYNTQVVQVLLKGNSFYEGQVQNIAATNFQIAVATIANTDVERVRVKLLPFDVNECESGPCGNRKCTDHVVPDQGFTCSECTGDTTLINTNCLPCDIDSCTANNQLPCAYSQNQCGGCALDTHIGFLEHGTYPDLSYQCIATHATLPAIAGQTLTFNDLNEGLKSSVKFDVPRHMAAFQFDVSSIASLSSDEYFTAFHLPYTPCSSSFYDVNNLNIRFAGFSSQPTWTSLSTTREIFTALNGETVGFPGSFTTTDDDSNHPGGYYPELETNNIPDCTSKTHFFNGTIICEGILDHTDFSNYLTILVWTDEGRGCDEIVTDNVRFSVTEKPKDCVVSDFVLGPCSTSCDSGTQIEAREVVEAANALGSCRELDTLEKILTCNENVICPDDKTTYDFYLAFTGITSEISEIRSSANEELCLAIADNIVELHRSNCEVHAVIQQDAPGNLQFVGNQEEAQESQDRRSSALPINLEISIAVRNAVASSASTALSGLPQSLSFSSDLNQISFLSGYSGMGITSPSTRSACYCPGEVFEDYYFSGRDCSATAYQFACPAGTGNFERGCTSSEWQTPNAYNCENVALKSFASTTINDTNVDTVVTTLETITKSSGLLGKQDVNNAISVIRNSLKGANITSNTLERLVTSTSNILGAPSNVVEDGGEASKDRGGASVEEIITDLVDTAGAIVENTQNTQIHIGKKNLVISAYKSLPSTGEWSWPPEGVIEAGVVNCTATCPVTTSEVALISGLQLSLPLTFGTSVNVRVAVVANGNGYVYTDGVGNGKEIVEGGKGINSKVIQLTVPGTNTDSLAEPFVFTVDIADPRDWTVDQHNCVFYNADGKSWDIEGCTRKSESTATRITCECQHLTSFAALTDTGGATALSSTDVLALNVITYIGMGLSIPALLLCVAVYAYFGDLRTDAKKVLMHLCMNLAIALAIFVFGIDEVGDQDNCQRIAVVLHFFLLVAFAWMLVEGYHLHRTFLDAIALSTAGSPLLRYSIFAYGVPAVIVGICAGVWSDGYGNEETCWLSSDGDRLVWAFIVPVVVVLLINTVFLVRVVTVIMRLPVGHRSWSGKTDNDGAQRRAQIKRATKASISFMVLMGLTWTFVLLTIENDVTAFHYLAAIFNGLQGLFIFIYHCVLDPKVRAKLSDGYTSTSASSSGPNHFDKYKFGGGMNTLGGNKLATLQPLDDQRNISSTHTLSSQGHSAPTGDTYLTLSANDESKVDGNEALEPMTRRDEISRQDSNAKEMFMGFNDPLDEEASGGDFVTITETELEHAEPSVMEVKHVDEL